MFTIALAVTGTVGFVYAARQWQANRQRKARLVRLEEHSAWLEEREMHLAWIRACNAMCKHAV